MSKLLLFLAILLFTSSTVYASPSPLHVKELPENAAPFLLDYADAAKQYDVPSGLLLALHQQQSYFGENKDFDKVGKGPMQFTDKIWQQNKTAVLESKFKDNHKISIYNNQDSIYAAAALLHKLGANQKYGARTQKAVICFGGNETTFVLAQKYQGHMKKVSKVLSSLDKILK